MTSDEDKTVILVDQDLPLGLAVNAASITACMIVTKFPQLMGSPVRTLDDSLPGVVLSPLLVLAGTHEVLQRIWREAPGGNTGVPHRFPFTREAQSCKSYEEYITKVGALEKRDLNLSALGLVGPRKLINSLCGDFPLYPRKAGK